MPKSKRSQSIATGFTWPSSTLTRTRTRTSPSQIPATKALEEIAIPSSSSATPTPTPTSTSTSTLHSSLATSIPTLVNPAGSQPPSAAIPTIILPPPSSPSTSPTPRPPTSTPTASPSPSANASPSQIASKIAGVTLASLFFLVFVFGIALIARQKWRLRKKGRAGSGDREEGIAPVFVGRRKEVGRSF
ncbi:hypothetical protein BDV95DRAFT_634980 [Massariosphaeria phaeospora]|uniref:Uncharacterized protein n=1 Tax=Massariosphaeria phaeospora TaxID=100035 RepID=A0A7C8IKA5_9PLEO|nr:hypothetical protein BDV95DRAFT_634980 [Massariosphaeria phaeospora]